MDPAQHAARRWEIARQAGVAPRVVDAGALPAPVHVDQHGPARISWTRDGPADRDDVVGIAVRLVVARGREVRGLLVALVVGIVVVAPVTDEPELAAG